MNGRIVASTIFMTCAQALIGCGGSNGSYTPISPSPTQPPIATPTPPPGEISIKEIVPASGATLVMRDCGSSSLLHKYASGRLKEV